MDLDGDKRIDFHEFYAATANYEAIFNESNIEKLFKIFDSNNMGTISMDNII